MACRPVNLIGGQVFAGATRKIVELPVLMHTAIASMAIC
jgi:hypothetical protein